MAIKIQGTTIIDDTANVSNICIINATTINATSVCASANLYGSGVNITNLPPVPVYACGIACGTIAAGDPVSLICCNCGIATTVGVSAQSYIIDCGSKYCNYGISYCNSKTDAATLSFGCSQSCFATLQIVGGVDCYNGSSWLGYNPACFVVRAHCISNTGTINSTTLCTYTYSGCQTCLSCSWLPYNRTISIPGCSGTTGAFLTPMCNGYCLQEIFLCYCTTTCTISVLRNCIGPMWGSYEVYDYPFLTPDGKYLISAFASANAVTNYTCTNGTNVCCYCGGCGSTMYNLNFPCSNTCIGMIVKATTDSVCYLTASAGNSCTALMKSALPASNVWVGGLQACINNNPGGYNPFTYGADGWLFFHLNVCNSGILNCCSVYPPCFKSAYFAVKPIGDNCYAMSSVLRPDCGATNTLIELPSCSGSGYGLPSSCLFNIDMGYTWDRGDNVKRQLTQVVCYSGPSSSCVTSLWSSIQCFCVASNTCLYTLATTCWCNCCAAQCICLCCLYVTGSTLGYPVNFMAMPTCAYCACSPAYGVCALNTPWNCRCNSQAWCSNSFGAGISNQLKLLRRSAVPICYQQSCYFFMTSPRVAQGCETYLYCGYNNLMALNNAGLCPAGPSCACCYMNAYITDNNIGVAGRFDGTNYCLCIPGCYNSGNIGIFSISSCYNTGYGPFSWYYPLNTPSSYLPGAVPNPIVSKNGCFFVGFSDQSTLASGSIICSGISCNMAWVLGTSTASSSTPTVSQWIGIAQNSASPGQTVCYATPGMIDRSPFSCCVCALTNSNITAGWNYCMSYCACTGCYLTIAQYMICANPSCAFFWQNLCTYPIGYCPGISLIGGTTNDCKYLLCYYCSNIQFTPVYDQGLNKWTTEINLRSPGYINQCSYCNFTCYPYNIIMS